MFFQQNTIDVASFASFKHTTPQLQFSLARLHFLALAGILLLLGVQTQFGKYVPLQGTAGRLLFEWSSHRWLHLRPTQKDIC